MTDYTVRELEEKIMNGETVSPSEFAEAMRNAEAADRIAELTKKGEQAMAENYLHELETLKQQANSANLNAGNRITIGCKISELEKKINDTNK
jgi:hypothetical protein